MDERVLLLIEKCQILAEYMEKDKENISEAINGEICRAYQETIELEINALKKIKQNLENIIQKGGKENGKWI